MNGSSAVPPGEGRHDPQDQGGQAPLTEGGPAVSPTRKRRASRRATVQMTRLEVAEGLSMVMRSPIAKPSPDDDGGKPGGASGTSVAAPGSPERGAEKEPGAVAGAGEPASDGRRRSTPGPPQGILPDKAAEDLDSSWGGSTGNPERDQWLKEQRPPHWD